MNAKVFGRPATPSIASQVMRSPSLASTPAPPQPADVVENPNLSNYYNALDAMYEILKLEHDPERRLKAEECRSFLETTIGTIEESDMTAQPPAPPPPMPGMLGPSPGPPGMPPPGGPMGGPPGGPLPGMPPQGPPQVPSPASPGMA